MLTVNKLHSYNVLYNNLYLPPFATINAAIYEIPLLSSNQDYNSG